ncbi:hypothetical protein SALBM135S_05539 [Streptomyces alboniger]
MPYRERPSLLTGAVVWTRAPAPGGAGDTARPVLPDGCMDLVWREGRLFVAGPDTRAHVPGGAESGSRHAGIRFYPGTAPALLGVAAHELRDRRVELADLWSAAEVRRLTERVDAADDPMGVLDAIAVERAAGAAPPDPLLAEVVRSLAAGLPVAATAAKVGLNARTLHRRSLSAFGYGPKTLARVLRLQRALALARAGLPYARTAAEAGFADQAHLARDVRELTGLTLGALLDGDVVQRREEVDTVAVRVEHGGVPLAPGRVERLKPALVSGARQLRVRGVDGLGGGAEEGEPDPPATGGRPPVGVEGADGLLGVEGDAQTAEHLCLDVRGALGVLGEAQAEPPVEGEGRGHVGDDEADEVEARDRCAVHAPQRRKASGPGS